MFRPLLISALIAGTFGSAMAANVQTAKNAGAEKVAALPPARPTDRTYMVFFETGKASLAPEGREIVRDAATAAREMQQPQIRVMVPGEGADAAGLAQSRARSVKAELVHDGMRPETIEVAGEPQAAPATGDPVLKEWVDRRAVIVLSRNQTS